MFAAWRRFTRLTPSSGVALRARKSIVALGFGMGSFVALRGASPASTHVAAESEDVHIGMMSSLCGSQRNHTALVGSDGVRTPLSLWGSCAPFETECFEGTVFLAHKPPPGLGIPFEFEDLLEGRGAPIPKWELQIQGRFKVIPEGTVFFGAELWDSPMQLGVLTRALCRVILDFGVSLLKKRGVELRHCFGDDTGARPVLAFPLSGADRIFCSDSPVSLPIQGDSRCGVWSQDSTGNWIETDKSSLKFEPGQYMTFLFATARVDWTSWTFRIPGIGALNLEQFWGKQAVHIVVFDEAGKHKSDRRLYLELQLESQRADPARMR